MREFKPVRLGYQNTNLIRKKDLLKQDEIISNFTYPRSQSAVKTHTVSEIFSPMENIEDEIGKDTEYSSNDSTGGELNLSNYDVFEQDRSIYDDFEEKLSNYENEMNLENEMNKQLEEQYLRDRYQSINSDKEYLRNRIIADERSILLQEKLREARLGSSTNNIRKKDLSMGLNERY